MTIRSKLLRSWLPLAALALAATGCRRDAAENHHSLGFEDFRPIYNRYIAGWIADQSKATETEIATTEAKLAAAADDQKEQLQVHLDSLLKDREKWRFRADLGDYLKISGPSEIPADLEWQDGMDQPEIGDPAAKKGGVFRRYIPTFPPTIRPFGENSNNSFRGDLYDYIELPLVNLHPETMEMIPGLAKEWALSKDGRTTYFRIDPEARYSDGEPVRARDFLVGTYLRVSDNIVNPYSKQYYRENIAQLATYDDLTLSVSLPEANLFAPFIAGAALPSPPHFYEEYGPDYSERFQWRFPPTTGAYEVLPDDIVKGASITQTRVRNWWAKDRKYYRHRFNPDKIVHTVVRDESKAFELFRAGELETFYLTRPDYWYEKSEIEQVYDGYIERVTYYNRYPKLPRGLYLNVSKPLLDDIDVRLGIQYATNWQKVIDVMFRGDFQRLNSFNEGYTLFSDPTIEARPFSIDKAREAFAKAGFVEEGRDGILRRADGTKLSLSLTYPAISLYDRMFAILREEAKKCGFDLRLDGLEVTVAYKKEMQKQHEITFGSWLISPPMPDFHQFMHSTNAYDDKGNVKPQTNNIFVWARPDTDVLCDKVRTGRTVEEVREATQKLQHIIHDECIFVPAWSGDFMRIGSWRWARWPDCENTRFSPPVVYDPHESFVFWIDEEMLADTREAMRTNRKFPESNRIVDEYRLPSPGQTRPDPEPAGEPEAPPAPEPMPEEETGES
ncbi:MAG: ABC transporter substrate-binding protein [Akkermansiaceae bacterium]|nr:ABC transporter substrate-binding protein [Akkermansiaceae bacterium]MCP5542508.1 ABC transporter substrate-binding protein [Akkermansiaceae bacterium]MCP5545957.1 ABC transporter substrate-binding protein [Akkermansiaceae bacterium]